MSGSSRPSANHSAPGLVVVGCASEDAESLHEALEALRRDGLEVELCTGLDQDPRRLSDVIDRHQGRGLYVLCRSPALGRERVEELREILLARHVPFARTLTVAVGGRGALADRIRSGLRRASARNTGPNRVVQTTHATEDEEPTVVGKREALGIPEAHELVASQPMPLPLRTAASASAEEDEAVPEEELDDEASEPDLLEDTNASWSGAVASLDLSDLDGGNTARTRMPPPGDVTAPGPPPALITGETVVGPAPAMITGDTVVGPRLSRVARDPSGRLVLPPLGPTPKVDLPPPPATGRPAHEHEPATTPFPRMTPGSFAPLLPPPAAAPPLPAPPAIAPSPPSPPPPSAAGSTLPPPSAAGSTLPPPSAAGSTLPPPSGALPLRPPSAAAPSLPSPSAAPSLPPPASAPSLPPPPAPSSMRSPAAAAPPPPVGPTTPAWASTAGASASSGASATSASYSYDDAPIPARSKVLPWALGGVALLLLALVIGLAVTHDRNAPEVASGGEDAPPGGDAATPSPSPAEASPTPPQAEPSDETPEVPEVYPVVAALESRKVRALDVLLIASAWGKPSDWSTAVAYCEALEVEGLTGWRLPHIGELHSLAEASMIGRGMYWSSTASDTFGDGHLAWNARRGHALPHSEDAVAVCVRGGASGS